MKTQITKGYGKEYQYSEEILLARIKKEDKSGLAYILSTLDTNEIFQICITYKKDELLGRVLDLISNGYAYKIADFNTYKDLFTVSTRYNFQVWDNNAVVKNWDDIEPVIEFFSQRHEAVKAAKLLSKFMGNAEVRMTEGEFYSRSSGSYIRNN